MRHFVPAWRFARLYQGLLPCRWRAYAGLRARGVAGAAVTYIGFGLPAFVMIMLLSALYEQTHNLSMAVSLFSGLQAIIVAIVAHAAFTFGKSYLKQKMDFAIAVLAASMFIFGISPFLVIILAACMGLVIHKDPDPMILPKTASSNRTPENIVLLMLISSGVAAGFVLLLNSSLWFNRAVSGILCSFVGLLGSVAFHFASNMPGDPAHAIMAVAAFIGLFLGVDLLWVILVGTVIPVFLL